MCRLTVYKGRPILIGDIVIQPENSLLYQSRDAAYHPGVLDKSHQRNILVNGDGFGVAWYGEVPSKGSCCFKFVTPAWSDTNLRNIGRHISSPLLFAHVRAAASGHNPHEPMIVSNENCHPFSYKEYTFMHNGGIPSFTKIKLKILNLLSPETFANIKGTTDTEYIFAIFLNCLPPADPLKPHSVSDMVDAMNQTVSIVVQLCKENGITEHCSLNLCVTNGIHIIATRFRNGPRSPPSLYYNLGSKFVCKDGHFYAEDDSIGTDIVISSAPLSKVCCHQDQSTEIEHDISYDDNDPTSPHIPRSPPGHNTTHPQMPHLPSNGNSHIGGLRPSHSSNSLRAVLESAYHEEKKQLSECMLEGPDADSGSDSDIGSWILIPKNHMLVCRGDASSHRVEHTYLEPIVVRTSAGPLSCPLYNCARKRKASTIAREEGPVHRPDGQVAHLTCRSETTTEREGEEIEAKRANLGVEDPVSFGSQLSATAVVTQNGTFVQCAVASPAVTGTPKSKPRIMKFTCQL